jgi:hypothetical protein
VFTNTSCLFYDSPESTSPFLQGAKTPDSDLWFLQVPTPPKPHHSPTILFTLQELPCARFVAYWHRAFGTTSLSTFLDICSLLQLHSRHSSSDTQPCPEISPLSLSLPSHLDTLRQGIASTRKSPSPSALALPSTHATRRRLAFLHDYDLSESASLDVSPSPSLAPLNRRSSRLGAPSHTETSQSTTSHRSEWLAVDSTGRFPIPSSLGHEYLLITPHHGFIHYYQPMKSRTAPLMSPPFAKSVCSSPPSLFP